MAHDIAPPPSEPQNRSKAREILNGLSHYRVDRGRIEMTDTTPVAKGGQGAIVFATLMPPEVLKGVPPEALEKLLFDKYKESLPDGTKETTPEELKELPYEEFKKRFANAVKDLFLERKVAVKQLGWPHDDPDEETKFFKSLVNELSLMASLSHPNVVKFLGFVEDIENREAWIILPWEANGNVQEFLKSGKWDIPERVSLIQDTTNGVEYLHTVDPPVCHGDLKSLNILVTSSYRAVITDFGSARVKRSTASCDKLETPDQGKLIAARVPRETVATFMTSTVTAGFTSPQVELNTSTLDLTLTGPLYSLRWTAPEVLNEGTQDLPSDMWALGWICWEIVTGRPPFDELKWGGAVISHTINGKLPAIREEHQLSHVLMLCGLMSECWCLDPAKRIDASNFQRKVLMLPSDIPSPCTPDGQKIRSARLHLNLGRMYNLKNDFETAESHYLSAVQAATQTEDENASSCVGALDHDKFGFGEAESSSKRAQVMQDDVANSMCTAGLSGNPQEIDCAGSKCRDGDHDGRKTYSIGDELDKANALVSLGNTYRVQSRNKEAEEVFNNAREIHSRIGNDLGIADALLGLGEAYRTQSKHQDAENAFETANKIYSRVGHDVGTANTLVGLGNTYRAQSSNGQAEKAFNAAHAIQSRIGDDLGAANALVGLGNTYRAQERNQDAERAFAAAYEIYSRIGDNSGSATALDGMGETYSAQSRPEEAEKVFRAAYEVHCRIGKDRLGTANALLGLGEAYRMQSMNAEAEKAFDDAHGIYSRIGSDLGTANAFLGLGNTYCAQARYQASEKALLAAVEIHSSISNDLGTATSFLGLGNTYFAQSKDQEAEDAFNAAYEIYSRIGNDSGVANALDGLGEAYRSQSKNQEAERAFMQVIEVYSRIGSDSGIANALVGLGNTYRAQDKSAEAEKAFNDAIAIHSSIGDHLSAGDLSRDMGIYHSDQCEYNKAESCYRQALGSYEDAHDDDKRAGSLLALGELHRIQKRYQEAEEVVTDAVGIWAKLADERKKAAAFFQLYEIFKAQSKHEEGIDALIQADLSFAHCGNDNARAVTLNLMGDIQLELGNCTEAKELYDLAESIFLSLDDADTLGMELESLEAFELPPDRDLEQ